eukprot:SAG31_NODE_5133_length_2722_cov_11.441860_2_plen_191_part_00
MQQIQPSPTEPVRCRRSAATTTPTPSRHRGPTWSGCIRGPNSLRWWRAGLFWNEPAKCTMHRYKESIKLGETPLSPKEVEQAIEDLKPRWMGHSYSLVEKNCCHCAHALAAALRVPPPPSFLNRAAESADAVENATEAVALMVAPVVAKVGGTLDDLLGDKAQAAATVVKAQHLRLSKKANTMIVASVVR